MKSPLPLNSACCIDRIVVMAILAILLLANLGLGSVGSRCFTPNVTDPTLWEPGLERRVQRSEWFGG
jgi:hypothetical protein